MKIDQPYTIVSLFMVKSVYPNKCVTYILMDIYLLSRIFIILVDMKYI